MRHFQINQKERCMIILAVLKINHLILILEQVVLIVMLIIMDFKVKILIQMHLISLKVGFLGLILEMVRLVEWVDFKIFLEIFSVHVCKDNQQHSLKLQ